MQYLSFSYSSFFIFNLFYPCTPLLQNLHSDNVLSYHSTLHPIILTFIQTITQSNRLLVLSLLKSYYDFRQLFDRSQVRLILIREVKYAFKKLYCQLISIIVFDFSFLNITWTWTILQRTECLRLISQWAKCNAVIQQPFMLKHFSTCCSLLSIFI